MLVKANDKPLTDSLTHSYNLNYWSYFYFYIVIVVLCPSSTKNLCGLPVALLTLLTESVLLCLTFKTLYNLAVPISAHEMTPDLVRVHSSLNLPYSFQLP